MKIMGLVFVFISFVFGGFYFYTRNISILKSIDRAENLLGIILRCLNNEQMTVEEIFINAKENSDSVTKKFIGTLEAKNLKNASKNAEIYGFTKNKAVFEILDKVFSVIGKYSCEEQIREIGFCRERLNDLYKKTEPEIKQKAKLSMYSGILCGFSAVILLI